LRGTNSLAYWIIRKASPGNLRNFGQAIYYHD
jgi:hypothetical protein